VFQNVWNILSKGEASVIARAGCPDHDGVNITFGRFAHDCRTEFPCLKQLRLEIPARQLNGGFCVQKYLFTPGSSRADLSVNGQRAVYGDHVHRVKRAFDRSNHIGALREYSLICLVAGKYHKDFGVGHVPVCSAFQLVSRGE
jgi:hypothetical protein